ncbi:MAG TPA: thermonuclease family protein [Bacillus sp. (in: firmicutes)]|nr:thermonuclease family protein [Bacillus sp. (in: firmicutes)]
MRYKGFKSMIIMVIVVVTTIMLSACQQESNRIPAVVERVVDGDTLKVNVNGKSETVRLLLVDTPESVHPSKPVQPYALEASNFLKEQLPPGKEVELELDVGERDKYRRLLAYVWIDGTMLNEQLLEKGYARVAYVFEPNTKYVDRFKEVQEKAQEQEVNIWSLENYATDKGFEGTQTKQGKQSENITQDCSNPSIKGNINSKGEKIYHTPQSPQYKVTKPEIMFCTEEEAKSAGFRPPNN